MTNKKRKSFLERLTGVSDEESNDFHPINEDLDEENDNVSPTTTYSDRDQNVDRDQKVEVRSDDSGDDLSLPDQEDQDVSRSDEEERPKKRRRKSKSSDLTADEEGQLALDVYQTPDEIVIKSTIAGVSSDDLDISIANDMVTIKGERKNNEEVSAEDYYYQECYWGKFSRSVILPIDIDPDKSKAILKNGILTIRLPKVEKTKTKKIKIVEE